MDRVPAKAKAWGATAARGLGLARSLGGFILKKSEPAAGPRRIWIDITSRCNLKCLACPQKELGRDAWRDLAPEILESLARQAVGQGWQVNLFHRGEPLLHPELPYWIKRFRLAGASVRLHTNATLLDADRVAGLLWAGPEVVTCSVDSLDPEQYRLARPGADLERTLAGMERLLRARRLLGLKYPLVGLLTMGEKRAPLAVQEAARLKRLQDLGLDRVIHRRPHNWAGAVDGPGQDLAQGPIRSACTFPWYGLAVLSDGRITPCPQDFFGDITLGRAGEDRLEDVWRSQGLKNLRRAHASGDLSAFPLCRACDRICRRAFLGLPTEHLKNFLAESIVSPDIL